MKIEIAYYNKDGTLNKGEYRATIKHQVIIVYNKKDLTKEDKNLGRIILDPLSEPKARFDFEISKRCKEQYDFNTEIIINEGNHKDRIYYTELKCLQKISLRLMFRRYYICKASFWMWFINIIVAIIATIAALKSACN
jgi:hypothetical protein